MFAVASRDAQTGAQPRILGLAPLRFILMGLLTIALYVAVQFALSLPRGVADPAMRGPLLLAIAGLGACAMVLLYRQLVRRFEWRAAREIDVQPGGAAAGMAIGILLFCAIYAVFFILGDADWKGYRGASAVWNMAAIALISGVAEEIIFRGVVFRIVEESAGTLVALLVSGAIFGGLHGVNPHATWFSSMAIAIEAGILLGAAYAYTGNLWLPIGLHAAWNFTEGGIFGAAVSGNAAQGLFLVPLHGPASITGGEFGPEASVVALALCSLISAMFLIALIRTGGWKPLHWSWYRAEGGD